MDQFDPSRDFAFEVPHDSVRYPAISEEIFQWKSKQKMKRGKVPTSEGKTDASSEVTTIDDNLDASTVAESESIAVQSQSSYSISNKKNKKRDRYNKKKDLEPPDSAHMDGNVIFESAPEKRVEPTEYSPFVTLSCPVCTDPDCVLNVAASCSLLRYNEKEAVECEFCEGNCECSKFKSKWSTVSGLVAKDENGVAETLLKKNGGPIENSAEWTNRKRWMVPYGISWEHQVSEWITSRMLETSKTTLNGVHRKRSKSKLGRRKSKHTTPTGVQSQVVMSNDNSIQEDKSGEPKVLLEGNGFKIVTRGNEKVLINYDKKNCKYLGCSCKKDSLTANSNCGCDSWREESHNKKFSKKDKSCRMSKQSVRVSMMKETPHGLVEVTMKEFDKIDKEMHVGLVDKSDDTESKNDEPKVEKISVSERKTSGSTQEKSSEKQGDRKKKKGHDNHDDDGSRSVASAIKALSGKDVRNASRAEVLEEHLRSTMGNAYKSNFQLGEQVHVGASGGCAMYPLPGQGIMAEVMIAPMEKLGPCVCSERYCNTSA